MEPFNLMWLEEPLPAENVDALRQVRARSRTPICVGENLYLRCAAVPNFLVLEWHALEEHEIRDSYVFAPDGSGSVVKDGHIAPTDKPGIGLELNMENVRKHAAPGFGVFE